MIVLDLKVNNLLQFNDFHINFTYPRKIVDSMVEDEHLKGFENFRYKKVNILFGTNATGKTSLGKVLMNIFNFITKRNVDKLVDLIIDKSNESSFIIDFATNEEKFFRVSVNIPIINDEFGYTLDDIQLEVKMINIWKNDSYETCSKRIESISANSDLRDIHRFGWRFSYPERDNIKDLEIEDTDDKYFKVLEDVLKTLDSSIIGIKEIDHDNDTYAIETCKSKIYIQNGRLLDERMLSSGTKDGIDIANFLFALIEHKNGFYYLDEKFVYVHSDIERELINVMIANLQYNEQLFITTHNLDIANINLPKHAFTFLIKEEDSCDVKIRCVSASDKLKKSTDSLKNAIDNDVFLHSPNVEHIRKYIDYEKCK